MTQRGFLPFHPGHRQKGISIVELLVGMAIGLLVLVAAVGSLVYTRVSSTVVGDSSRLQQDASTAFRIIGHQIRQSGARRVIGELGGNVEFNSQYVGAPVPYDTATATGTSVLVGGTDGANDAPDTLQISYDTAAIIPANPDIPANSWPNQNNDCIGERTAFHEDTPSFPNTVFSVFAVNANQELTCDGSGPTDGAIALVQGVEDFQVWYGARNTGNDQLTYQSSPTPPTANHQIETVMVCLRMAGQATGNPGANTTGCNGQVIADDGRIRRTFFRVFNMRNAGL